MSKVKQATRRSERALAFQVLYSLCFTPATDIVALRKTFHLSPDNADKMAKLYALELANREARQLLNNASHGEIANDDSDDVIDYTKIAPRGFAWELVEGVWSNTADLDDLIKEYSHNWRVHRIGRIELTVLRLSLFEILYRTDIPAKVAINEAMELAKAFGDSKAKAFINGILDTITKALETNKIQFRHSKNSSV